LGLLKNIPHLQHLSTDFAILPQIHLFPYPLLLILAQNLRLLSLTDQMERTQLKRHRLCQFDRHLQLHVKIGYRSEFRLYRLAHFLLNKSLQNVTIEITENMKVLNNRINRLACTLIFYFTSDVFSRL